MKYSWQRQIILETIQEHKEHLLRSRFTVMPVSAASYQPGHGVPQPEHPG